jgi:hypothetical protein
VNLPSLLRIRDRADRSSLGGEQAKHLPESLTRPRLERDRWAGAHSASSGATTTRRSGSSPSL